jgi:hypothetical protein
VDELALRLGSSLGDVGDAGKKTELSDFDGFRLAASILDGLRAAGGRAKQSEPSTVVWSLIMNSPDMEGVGGNRERDMIWMKAAMALDAIGGIPKTSLNASSIVGVTSDKVGQDCQVDVGGRKVPIPGPARLKRSDKRVIKTKRIKDEGRHR